MLELLTDAPTPDTQTAAADGDIAPAPRMPALPPAFARGAIPRRHSRAAPQQRVTWYRHAPAAAAHRRCG
ncbi:MAG: hypothetical protein GVY13_10600 [Alphaproteobacteria bacterium]|jgi:hypothetical protein|nr:hypothetical protein [Alphaproteobacteria bacterium]